MYIYFFIILCCSMETFARPFYTATLSFFSNLPLHQRGHLFTAIESHHHASCVLVYSCLISTVCYAEAIYHKTNMSSTSAVSRLSSDDLQAIFEFLPPNALLKCMLVCKKWKVRTSFLKLNECCNVVDMCLHHCPRKKSIVFCIVTLPSSQMTPSACSHAPFVKTMWHMGPAPYRFGALSFEI
jgi:hypothetical protein